MRIESYQFGKMVIDGIQYTHDVIIHKNEVQADWWRERSHHLTLADFPCLQDEKPDVLIIGTGKFGLIKIHKDVRNFCEQNGIELICKDSSNAVDTFNDMQNSGKHIIAAFHLTC
ncbi:hypothetical protein D4R71_00725 [bacterium]|nr:MAG: hypothetical protein D4R71_00725 [bacterium]